jgi:myo-inositol catabolism protein IolH
VTVTLAADTALLRARALPDVFGALAELGYKAAEISPRPDLFPPRVDSPATAAVVAEAGRESRGAGVDVASLMVIYNWSSPDELERKAAVRQWRKAIEIAGELGCRRINTELTGTPHYPQECEASFRKSIEELLPLIEEADLHVFVEPHPYDFIETGVEATRVLREAGSSRLGYIYCTPHTFYLGGTIEEQVAVSGDLLGHVHLGDTFAPARIIVNPRDANVRVHQHLDIGQGEVPWPRVFNALKAADFNGLLTVCVFAWPDRALESLRQNLHSVRQLAKKAGLQL